MTARAAAHQVLAARGSTVALYDLRETVESGEPAPVEMLAALEVIGDRRPMPGRAPRAPARPRPATAAPPTGGAPTWPPCFAPSRPARSSTSATRWRSAFARGGPRPPCHSSARRSSGDLTSCTPTTRDHFTLRSPPRQPTTEGTEIAEALALRASTWGRRLSTPSRNRRARRRAVRTARRCRPRCLRAAGSGSWPACRP